MNKPFAARLTAALKLLASAFSLLCLSMTKASRYAQMATCIIALLSMATVTNVMAAAQKPNVLFISVDDLNDWVGYLGGHAQASTPNIDALAEQGAAFTHAYSSASACGPSRTALMYGSYPHRSGSYGHHKVYSPAQLLAKDRLPLNLVFQQNGYYTAGAGKIFHFEEKRGWHNYQKKFKGIKTKNEALGNNISLEIGVQQTDNDSDTSDGQMTDWVINELQRKHDKPFFIALGLKKPHLPFVAPRKYFEQHDLKTIKLPEVPAGDLNARRWDSPRLTITRLSPRCRAHGRNWSGHTWPRAHLRMPTSAACWRLCKAVRTWTILLLYSGVIMAGTWERRATGRK